MLAYVLLTHGSIYFLLVSYFIVMTGFGMLQPLTTSIALDAERDNAGAASAVFGASNFIAGALASPLVTLGDLLVSTSAVMVAGALSSMVLTVILIRRMKRTGSPATPGQQ